MLGLAQQIAHLLCIKYSGQVCRLNVRTCTSFMTGLVSFWQWSGVEGSPKVTDFVHLDSIMEFWGDQRQENVPTLMRNSDFSRGDAFGLETNEDTERRTQE